MRFLNINKYIGYEEFSPGHVPDSELVLPTRVKLIDSNRFVDVDTDFMYIEGDTANFHLRLNSQMSAFSAQTRHSVIYSLLAALNSKKKVSTVMGWVTALERFSQEILNTVDSPISTITLSMFVGWQLSKGASNTKMLRSAILYWIRCGGSGIAQPVREYLKASRSPPSRGSIEIQNTVPSERPLPMGAVSELLEQLDNLYINRVFNHQENAIWRLLISEGMRPSQIRLLQIGDVTINRNESGDILSVYLDVPLVKQKGAAGRENLTNKKLSDAVGRSIVEHIKYLGEISDTPIPDSNPLFCVRKGAGFATISKKPMNIHDQIAKTAKILSPLVNDERLFSRRLKHTKLTHLAILGASVRVLAIAGYQTSTGSLSRYVNLTDEAFLKYEEQLDSHFESISECLSIKIIDRQNATIRDPKNTISDLESDGDAGSCSAQPCGAMATLACYVCPRFEAFRDGPHGLVLTGLLKRKKRAIEKGLPPETIKRDDRIINSVQRVIWKIANES